MSMLYMLCGIPASGKSTWARKMLEKNRDWAYISRDEVRFTIIKEEDDYFSKEKQVFQKFVSQISSLLDNPEIPCVIADATHVNESSRSKLIHAINSCRKTKTPLKIVMVFFDTPLEECLRRNAERKGRARVPDKVMEQMFYNREFPQYRKELVRVEVIR